MHKQLFNLNPPSEIQAPSPNFALAAYLCVRTPSERLKLTVYRLYITTVNETNCKIDYRKSGLPVYA